jgi:hypothetical protein
MDKNQKDRRARQQPARSVVLPNEFRDLMKEVLLENSVHSARISAELATKFCRDNLGMTPEAHKLDHILFSPMIPWLKAKQEREVWIYETLKNIFTENVQLILKWSVRILIVATILGLSGSWTWFIDSLVHLKH